MVERGIKAVTLEVSSQGLEQNRVASIDFDTCIFTNLTHDHLDYHGTMENYYEAKKKLFTNLDKDKTAIINIDDPYGQRLLQECQARIVSYGINNQANYMAKNIQILSDRTVFTLQCYQDEYRVESNLVAMFNLYNLLAIIAACHQNGMTMEDIIQSVRHIQQVDGRMELIKEGQHFSCIVDYAHTPDGFEKYSNSQKPLRRKGRRSFRYSGQPVNEIRKNDRSWIDQ